MKITQSIMGMPVTVEVVDSSVKIKDLKQIFDYFKSVDKKFSTFKINSEVSKINSKVINIKKLSKDMKEIIELCEKTKKETNGYFDPYHNGYFDPSGIVKGWSIQNASKLLFKKGFKNFYIEAGGDVQVYGKNAGGEKWRIGIRNPFKKNEIIKVIFLTDYAIATSGEYERGKHIYNPRSTKLQKEIVSFSVVSKNILDADRFATAAFAMGKKGILFLQKQKNLESFMIDTEGIATYTDGFDKYTFEETIIK